MKAKAIVLVAIVAPWLALTPLASTGLATAFLYSLTLLATFHGWGIAAYRRTDPDPLLAIATGIAVVVAIAGARDRAPPLHGGYPGRGRVRRCRGPQRGARIAVQGRRRPDRRLRDLDPARRRARLARARPDPRRLRRPRHPIFRRRWQCLRPAPAPDGHRRARRSDRLPRRRSSAAVSGWVRSRTSSATRTRSA